MANDWDKRIATQKRAQVLTYIESTRQFLDMAQESLMAGHHKRGRRFMLEAASQVTEASVQLDSAIGLEEGDE